MSSKKDNFDWNDVADALKEKPFGKEWLSEFVTVQIQSKREEAKVEDLVKIYFYI